MSSRPPKGSALDIPAPAIGAEEIAEVVETLESGRLSTSPRVITTPLTFCAAENVVIHTGATPVFADIDPETFNLHPFYQERFGLRRGMFPAAKAVSDSTLSLPLPAAMAPEAVERVIEALHDVLG
jgi:dTDP-4-amino-4,6-dideoxygalactose transaminase